MVDIMMCTALVILIVLVFIVIIVLWDIRLTLDNMDENIRYYENLKEERERNRY